MFNNIHGLLEAKVLLKHLYNTGVQYLLDSKLKQVQFETNSNSMMIILIILFRSNIVFAYHNKDKKLIRCFYNLLTWKNFLNILNCFIILLYFEYY